MAWRCFILCKQIFCKSKIKWGWGRECPGTLAQPGHPHLATSLSLPPTPQLACCPYLGGFLNATLPKGPFPPPPLPTPLPPAILHLTGPHLYLFPAF